LLPREKTAGDAARRLSRDSLGYDRIALKTNADGAPINYSASSANQECGQFSADYQLLLDVRAINR
jgi:hypothetical protein